MHPTTPRGAPHPDETTQPAAGPATQISDNIARDDIEEALARIRRVPDRYREFVQDERSALRQHAIPLALLEKLGDLGLPFKRAGGSRYHDQLDLTNMALALRLSNARTMVMRGWATSLRATADAAATIFEVDVKAHCPAPGHQEDCAYALSDTLRSLPGYAPGGEARTGLLRRRIARPAPEAPAHALALADLVKPLTYHLLPEGLRADLGFLAETGLADCALAARFLTREARAMGLTARYSYGLFLALPYSMIHSWMEVRTDGEWSALDPHLINLLTDWSLLDPVQWPPHRSIDGCTVHIADHDKWLITHHGVCAPLSMTTRRFAAETA